VLSGGGVPEGWHDVLGEIDFYGYLRSRKTPSHTFFARVSAAGAWSMVTPLQLTLGGRQALRGLREEHDPGARRVLVTLEDRYFLGWPAPSAFDFGLTLFADAGRVWAGEVPYGVDSGWKGTVGAGIRLGFPAGTRGVARLDLAFPVGAGDTGGPIFRVTLFELLGLTTGFADPQMQRSRRLAVGPDFFTTDRR
jgi:outer membrane protein assembly factor BamA